MSDEIKPVVLGDEDIERLNGYDQSVTMWSVRYSQLSLEADQVKDTLKTLSQAKLNMLYGKAKEAGFEQSQIKELRINKSSKVMEVVLSPIETLEKKSSDS